MTDRHATRLGMWIFLGSETLLFAALFAVYLAYRSLYHSTFLDALGHSDQVLGTLNTVVLITSSLTVALAVDAARGRRWGRCRWLLGATLLLALGFLTIKGFEYGKHFQDGIYPGGVFPEELDHHGARLFFLLYFFMTGLHALHVVGGMAALGIMLVRSRSARGNRRSDVGIEMAALYWHLVDAVWIFLWPLFYLLR